MRLPAEFKRVFQTGRRLSDSCFTLLVAVNQFGCARLGLAVSRKAGGNAVSRNRLKRLIRESFRAARQSLPAVDVVAMVRPAAMREPNTALLARLAALWQKID